MLSSSFVSLSSLSFDMVSKTTIKHRNENKDDIDKFINEYLSKNINQGDDMNRWIFALNYSKHLPINIVDQIIHLYGNDKIVNDLVDFYFEIFNHMEFVFEKHINMIEQENDDNIKRNLVSLILFNSITYSSFLY
jgi:hypothetical protein